MRRRSRASGNSGLKFYLKSIAPWSDLNDVPDIDAKVPLPDEWRALLSRERISFTVRAGSKPHLEPVAEIGGNTWTLSLPETAEFGLCDVKYHRANLKRSRAKTKSLVSTNSHRPAWARQQLVPRANVSVGRRYMRTLDGSLVKPLSDGIFGPDDRREYLPFGFPWQCVGLVQTRFGSASGVLVGTRHVLTASHVIPWSEPSSIRFTPGFYDGQSILGAGATSFATDVVAWRSLDVVAAYDMAVIRLVNPLGSIFGFWGTMEYNAALNDRPVWQLLGYPAFFMRGGQWHSNQPTKPLAQANIAVLETDSDGTAMELKHHGDATEGDSGGPLMGFSVRISPPPSKTVEFLPMAIGVTSGQIFRSFGDFVEWDVSNVAAGGRALVELVQLAQTMWP